MKTIEEVREASWQTSRGEETYDPNYPVKASSNFADGVMAEMERALSHQWISVDEELPPDDDDVIVAVTGIASIAVFGIAWYCKSDAAWYSNEDAVSENKHHITHWMPIPPMPEA